MNGIVDRININTIDINLDGQTDELLTQEKDLTEQIDE